jgi:hypothetical protein
MRPYADTDHFRPNTPFTGQHVFASYRNYKRTLADEPNSSPAYSGGILRAVRLLVNSDRGRVNHGPVQVR